MNWVDSSNRPHPGSPPSIKLSVDWGPLIHLDQPRWRYPCDLIGCFRADAEQTWRASLDLETAGSRRNVSLERLLNAQLATRPHDTPRVKHLRLEPSAAIEPARWPARSDTEDPPIGRCVAPRGCEIVEGVRRHA